MEIKFEKQLTPNGTFYYSYIEKSDKTFLKFCIFMYKTKEIEVNFPVIKDLEDFNLFQEGLERTYSYALKDNKDFSNIFIGDYIFGIDDRNNIIYGEVISSKNSINNTYKIKLINFNDIDEVEIRNRILDLDLNSFIKVEDTEGLERIKLERKDFIEQKLFVNRIEDHIFKTNRNIELLRKKISNIDKELNNLYFKENSSQIAATILNLEKSKKHLETKLKNTELKLEREENNKKLILEDKVFNDIIDKIAK